MSQDVTDAIESRDIEEARERFTYAAKLLGFNHFALGLKKVSPIEEPDLLLINSYPNKWNQLYLDGNFLSKDPIVAKGFTTTHPFLWQDTLKQGSEI
ncbi:autoinducer binding domain-containing protein [Vibrio breoganii]